LNTRAAKWIYSRDVIFNKKYGEMIILDIGVFLLNPLRMRERIGSAHFAARDVLRAFRQGQGIARHWPSLLAQ